MFSVRCPSPRRVLLSQQHPFQITAQRANGKSWILVLSLRAIPCQAWVGEMKLQLLLLALQLFPTHDSAQLLQDSSRQTTR